MTTDAPAKKTVPVEETPEYKKLLKENEKLEQTVKNQKSALKGKQTEITKLKEQVQAGSRMTIRRH